MEKNVLNLNVQSKKQVTIRLDEEVVDYFKKIAKENDFSYQHLINLHLKSCVQSNLKPKLTWV